MFEKNASTNEKHKFYNSMVQAISRVGGDCFTKVGSICNCFVEMRSLVKTQVKMGSVSSLISGVRSLIFLTKPFLP